MVTIAGIMCVWEEETMSPYAIKAIAPYIDELIVINKPGRDDTEGVIKNTCREHGLKLIYENNKLKLRYARMKAFTMTDCDWCLIVDGDEVYHTDGVAGIHTVRQLIDLAPDEGCVYRAPMNYLYLDFLHTRDTQRQMVGHKFLYKNDEKVVQMENKRNLPRYNGTHITLKHIYKFNCGVKPPDRISLRRRYLIRWRKRYDGELDFYPWLETQKYELGKTTLESLYKRNEVIPYDEKKWGQRPKTIRDMINKGVIRP